MINLEQVKLLEAKVAKTIDYVERVSKDNAALLKREAELQEKLETYQKRNEELEVLIGGFKEEQGRIEDGILAALDRLGKFEEAIDKSLKEKSHGKTAKDAIKPPGHNLPQKKSAKEEKDGQADFGAGNEKICFEIPDDEAIDDISDPLTETPDDEDDDSPAEVGELDIF